MTSEEFTRNLPPYANDPARSKPPFVFNNLSARVFPLRASLAALQHMCDSYLNFVPQEVGRFRAVMPYVYLALLDYGQISEMVDSVGWFAQTEVYFGIPVEWYLFVNGKWVFHDWAVLTPFIYVDDDFSVPLGRSVFGFPKTLAKVTKTASDWLRDPVAPVTLARVETRVFPELYKKRRLESHVFLEVERDAPMSNFRIPPDPKGPMTPWAIAGRLAETMAGFGRDAMSISQSMRIFEPNPGTDPAFGAAMLNRMMPAFLPGGKGFTLNSVNLKQFRSASHPHHICYQALTNGRMQMTAFNGSGLLGEERMGLGDMTGGYTIKLHEYSSLPIARTLGLEVHRRWRGNHGVDVASFKPLMPFWANLNVKYLAGTNLAWRTGENIWYGGNGNPLELSQHPPEEGFDSTLYNTTVASAVDDAITGPFQFTGTTVRVLPLLASRKKLEDFLDKTYINCELRHGAVSKNGERKRFKLSLWSRPELPKVEGKPIGGEYAYVYLTATSFGGVTSKTNDVGDWAKYELSFLIPVKFKCMSMDGSREIIEGVGLVPAGSFVDDTTAAVTRTEVLGIPTLRANFVRPASVWLQEGELNLDAKQTLLRVDAEVFTAFHVGQQASKHPLLEISSRDDGSVAGQWESHENPIEWAEKLQLELETKKRTANLHLEHYNLARSLALEILGNQVPVALYTLKQFRDAADPGKACYQSLVRVSRIFDEIFDIQEIEETLRVRIHDFPSLPLVETLGIVANPIREDGTGVTFETQAIRPFYIRATITEKLGERLLWRTGTSEWKFNEKVFEGLLDDNNEDKIKVDAKALEMQDQGDPCQMNRIMHESVQRRQSDTPEPCGLFTTQERKELWKNRKLYCDNVTTWYSDKKNVGTSADNCPKEADNEPLGKLEKRLRQPIRKEDARDALDMIDPQMVIESILSREWGNFNEKARWRVGRNETISKRELDLANTPAAFVALELLGGEFIKGVAAANQPVDRSSKRNASQQQTRIEHDQIADQVHAAIGKGFAEFAKWEQELYKERLNEKAHSPGRRRLKTQVDPMIEQMKLFTEARLVLDGHFGILSAWSKSRQSGTADPRFSKAKLKETTDGLLYVMGKILNLKVIGEPSKENNQDVQVSANFMRLRELLDILSRPEYKNLEHYFPGQKPRQTKTKALHDQQDNEQATVRAWQLIERYRDAVHAASKCCDAQYDALLNKLSRAFQKPDFCVRRDSAGPYRDTEFPMTLSWDGDWYYGKKISSDDDTNTETE